MPVFASPMFLHLVPGLILLADVSAYYVTALPEIQLGNTKVIGIDLSASNIEFFGGIPFAEPPIGNLRFKPPVLRTSLSGSVFDARQLGAACLQADLPADTVSEDCLTLNIFRPAGLSSDAAIPVMVWLYGGGFVVGASSQYNGTEIVTRSIARGTPIIFVGFNYRLGPLGFPLGAEAARRGLLNLGLKDQLAALQWIQANVRHFGGSPSKVTIFGESAGALSIDIHLLGTEIQKLARGAILESMTDLPTFGPTHNEATWQRYLAAVPECASSPSSPNAFDCLINASSSDLLNALGAAGISLGERSYFPVIDGPDGLLPDLRSRLLYRSKLPVIIGTNLDEGTFVTPQATNSTLEIQQSLLNATSPSACCGAALDTAVKDILELYPDIPSLNAPFGTGNETFGLSSQYKRYAAIFADLLWTAPRRALSHTMSKAGVEVFAYLFSDPDAVIPPFFLELLGSTAPGSRGVSHSTEIFYVFGTLANPTPTAVKLSSVMMDYWISFATSLDPNDGFGSARPGWTKFAPDNQAVMQLNGHNTTMIPDDFRPRQITFLDNHQTVLNQ